MHKNYIDSFLIRSTDHEAWRIFHRSSDNTTPSSNRRCCCHKGWADTSNRCGLRMLHNAILFLSARCSEIERARRLYRCSLLECSLQKEVQRTIERQPQIPYAGSVLLRRKLELDRQGGSWFRKRELWLLLLLRELFRMLLWIQLSHGVLNGKMELHCCANRRIVSQRNKRAKDQRTIAVC